MTDKEEKFSIDSYEFAEELVSREFLGANKRDSEGKSLFPELGSEMTLTVSSIEPFRGRGKQKVALVLVDKQDREWLFPINVTNERAIRSMGYTNPNELLKKKITIKSYHTGNTGQFEIGLEVVNIE